MRAMKVWTITCIWRITDRQVSLNQSITKPGKPRSSNNGSAAGRTCPMTHKTTAIFARLGKSSLSIMKVRSGTGRDISRQRRITGARAVPAVPAAKPAAKQKTANRKSCRSKQIYFGSVTVSGRTLKANSGHCFGSSAPSRWKELSAS